MLMVVGDRPDFVKVGGYQKLSAATARASHNL
jgi:hypothetical protein